MNTYAMSKESLFIIRANFVFCLLSLIGLSSFHAPFRICILGAPYFLFSFLSLGLAVSGSVIQVDAAGVRFCDKSLWRFGYARGAAWGDVSSVDVRYFFPGFPGITFCLAGEAGHKAMFISLRSFPPELLLDILSRLPCKVEVTLSPEIREKFDV
jgi:hypothetical protein